MTISQKKLVQLVLLFFLFLLLAFVLLWKSSSMIISPRIFHGSMTPDVLGMPYEDVTFITDDGITIRGWYIGSDSLERGIIFLHGFGVDKSDLVEVAQLFYQKGYALLLFDFRAHGESGGDKCSLGFYEIRDLNAAVHFLKDRGIRRIGAMGFSMGGTVALLAASENRDILAIVSDSGYLSFSSAVRDFSAAYYRIPEFPLIPPIVWFAGKRIGIDPGDMDLSRHLSSIAPRPIFIVHAEDDREITVSNAHLIYQFADQPKELWLVKNGGHLGAHALCPHEYERRVTQFFDHSLSPAKR
jgi:esterase/lipase